MSITMHTGPNTARPAVTSLAARMLTLCYGGLAYLIFLGTFLYAVGFVSGFVVPKTVDKAGRTETPLADDGAADQPGGDVDLRRAAQRHGAPGLQALFMRFASPAIERSTYVLLASLSLILLYWQWQPMPTMVWNIENSVIAGIVTASASSAGSSCSTAPS